MHAVTKLSLALLAGFAATAQARAHAPGAKAHLYRRLDNSTTTLTVLATSVATIVSCETTVTDCPADSTAVVTTTIPVLTTVCPVADASSISESVLAEASTAAAVGGDVPVLTSTFVVVPVAASTDAPVSTGTAPAAGLPVASGTAQTPFYPVNKTTTALPDTGSLTAIATIPVETTETVVEVTDSATTITLGSGSATTVITSTVLLTTTSTRISVSARRSPDDPRPANHVLIPAVRLRHARGASAHRDGRGR